MNKKQIRLSPLWGLFGFSGFMGLMYFSTHEAAHLFFFSFFSFFGFYFVGKLSREMPDERYRENDLKARAKASKVPASAIFLIGLSAGFPFGTKLFMIIVSAIGWSAYFLTYYISFYYFEKH